MRGQKLPSILPTLDRFVRHSIGHGNTYFLLSLNSHHSAVLDDWNKYLTENSDVK
jgi:hypothetical protein